MFNFEWLRVKLTQNALMTENLLKKKKEPEMIPKPLGMSDLF